MISTVRGNLLKISAVGFMLMVMFGGASANLVYHSYNLNTIFSLGNLAMIGIAAIGVVMILACLWLDVYVSEKTADQRELERAIKREEYQQKAKWFWTFRTLSTLD